MSQGKFPPNAAAEAGERHFRRLILTLLALSGAITAVLCIYQYWAYIARASDGHSDFYKVAEERAALTYYLIWGWISLLGFAAACSRKTAWLSHCILLLLLAEMAANAYFLATQGHLYRPVAQVMYGRFDPHPFVIAVPHPGVLFPGVTHDPSGRRTTINEGKVANPKLVFVFGGSAAYDVGNTDPDTWPSQLSRLLGANFEVRNLAVPAFSSAEAMTQSLFAFRESRPACALYYEGWNDLRNAHVRDLRVDYSNFEYSYLVEGLYLKRHPSIVESNSLLLSYFMSMFEPRLPPDATGEPSDKEDMRLSGIYRDNIRLIGAIGRVFGVRVIFVPQILNYSKLAKDPSAVGWPFVRAKDMGKLMRLMNQNLAEAAGEFSILLPRDAACGKLAEG